MGQVLLATSSPSTTSWNLHKCIVASTSPCAFTPSPSLFPHPANKLCLKSYPYPPKHPKGRTFKLFSTKDDDHSVEAAERILSACAYILPFLDGLHYGRFVYAQAPSTQPLLRPLFSLLKIYSILPLASFLFFFLLYFAVVRNPNFSRYVRFNTMQALVLDLLLIPPNLLGLALSFTGGPFLEFVSTVYSAVFVYVVSCFLFGVGACILGKTPRIPLVSDTADAQVPWF